MSSSEVIICNMALGHLGDRATVTSIDPAEGSPQAAHCAQFYGAARDAAQEAHTWSFCKRRTALAEVTNPSTTWQYAYAVPNLAVNILAVLDPEASDDFSSSAISSMDAFDSPTPINATFGAYTPQQYDLETASDGSQILLTNQVDAVCRYTVLVEDTAKFTPMFVRAVSWLLAADLAGPVLKGETGAAAALKCMKMYDYWIGQAKMSDANSRNVKPQQQVPWLAARG